MQDRERKLQLAYQLKSTAMVLQDVATEYANPIGADLHPRLRVQLSRLHTVVEADAARIQHKTELQLPGVTV